MLPFVLMLMLLAPTGAKDGALPKSSMARHRAIRVRCRRFCLCHVLPRLSDEQRDISQHGICERRDDMMMAFLCEAPRSAASMRHARHAQWARSAVGAA